MSRRKQVVIIMTALIVFLGLGYLGANVYLDIKNARNEQKPVLEIKHNDMVDNSTQIVFEQEYLKSGHVIISEFEKVQELRGKSLEELRKIYTIENGYSLKLQDNILTIHQEIDDWCPADKEKRRLKEYQGWVAIYKGPDMNNDILEKVTSINMKSLPEEIQLRIKRNEFEFKDEQVLYDVLATFDDYL